VLLVARLPVIVIIIIVALLVAWLPLVVIIVIVVLLVPWLPLILIVVVLQKNTARDKFQGNKSNMITGPI
jgi:hypothetical protein